MFFSPFSIAITSLGGERVNLSIFRMFDRFVLVWICRFPIPLYVWEGLRFVIVTPWTFLLLFFIIPRYHRVSGYKNGETCTKFIEPHLYTSRPECPFGATSSRLVHMQKHHTFEAAIHLKTPYQERHLCNPPISPLNLMNTPGVHRYIL